jgi:hypothetical protein
VSEFIRPLPPDHYPGPTDSHLGDEPTPSAGLSIVLEADPGATIGELARRLVRAILIAVSGRTRVRHSDNPPGDPQIHPPGSHS